jgi:hypothetical protein
MAKTRKRKGYSYRTHIYSLPHFRSIRKGCERIPPDAMQPDPESAAKNRLTYYFKDTDPLVSQIYNTNLVQTMRTLVGNPRLGPCPHVPVEYRIYSPGSSMDWHIDRQMLPDQCQYECVITLRNTSDSETLVKQGTRAHRNKHLQTEPNSLFVVQANGVNHCVTPITKGSRSILKVVFYDPY